MNKTKVVTLSEEQVAHVWDRSLSACEAWDRFNMALADNGIFIEGMREIKRINENGEPTNHFEIRYKD